MTLKRIHLQDRWRFLCILPETPSLTGKSSRSDLTRQDSENEYPSNPFNSILFPKDFDSISRFNFILGIFAAEEQRKDIKHSHGSCRTMRRP